MIGSEDGVLMNGSGALITETSKNSVTPSIMEGHREKVAVCEPGSRLSSTLNLLVP